MKSQNNVTYFTCTEEELINGVPHVKDENGVGVPQNSICELLNDDSSITSYFQFVGSDWFKYGSPPITEG